MEYIHKKTTELSTDDKKAILDLFNIIFKQDRTLEVNSNQYTNNICGYSYHSLIYYDNKIVGQLTVIPCYYYIDGQKVFCGNCSDGMIEKSYRDSTVLLDQYRHFCNYLREEGVTFFYGFPNTYAMKVYLKARLYKKIGELSTYCLPYRIGGIKKYLRIFNPLSTLFTQIHISISSIFSSRKIVRFRIEKDGESYNASRYKRMDGEYQIVVLPELKFMYKVNVHDGIRTVFLIDVVQKSAQNFNRSVRYIIKHEKQNFDLLLYIGHLPFKCTSMIKIPRKYEPKQFNLAIIFLDKKIEQDTLLNLDNWDMNLSNYDLI